MARDDLDRELASLGILGDPVRRRLYLHVVSSPEAVGRDEAARVAGISRSLAAFHLDRLVDAGLLEPEYRRLTGRSGPGAGRPAKLYRPRGEISVTVPERDYELAARLLIQGLRRSEAPDEAALEGTALERGRAMGAEARAAIRGRKTRAAVAGAVVEVLRDQGFHPSTEPDGTIRLRNCPFDALADGYPETMCRLNLDLLRGLLEGLGAGHLEARPRPRNGMCCVELAVASVR